MKSIILIVIMVSVVFVTGCKTADVVPDSYKFEANFDDRSEYKGYKTGFSWDIPQPK